MPKRDELREKLRSGLWFVPGVIVLASIVAALVLTEVDRVIQRTESGTGLQRFLTHGPEAADAILSVVAGSMLSLTVLVFSITMIVLQLASSQYSPGTMRRFFRDRSTKLALGLFLGTFVFALAGLRAVRYGTGDTGVFVPGLAVFTAFLLVVASLAVFLQYIHHVTQAIRASSMIAVVAEEASELVRRLPPLAEQTRPEPAPPGHGEYPHAVAATRPGYVATVDAAGLAVAASEADLRLETPTIGTFVPRGGILLRASAQPPNAAALARHVTLSEEPSPEHDIVYALRQLSGLATRALSPGALDANVAIEALDRLEPLMCALGGRSLCDRVGHDRTGAVRVRVPAPTWEECLHAGLADVAVLARPVPSTRARLDALLARLRSSLPEERATAFDRWLLGVEERGAAREGARAPVPV